MQDIDLTIELSESDWIESKSLKAFMEPRLRMASLSAITMISMALLVYGHADSILIGFWLVASLVVVSFRTHVVTLFNRHFFNRDVLLKNSSARVAEQHPSAFK